MIINGDFIFKKIFQMMSECLFYISGFYLASADDSIFILTLFNIIGMSLGILELFFGVLAIGLYLKNTGLHFINYDSFDEWRFSFNICFYKKITFFVKTVFYFCFSITGLVFLRDIEELFYRIFVVLVFVYAVVIGLLKIIFSISWIDNKFFYKPQVQPIMKITNHVLPPNDECSICLEKNTHPEWCELPCNHKFHFKCVENWIKSNNSCPVCRYTSASNYN